MGTHIYNLQIRVLIYREDGAYVAHALELDILAYAKTERAAVRELGNLIDSQLSFAHQKQDTGLLTRPAPKEYFERWEKAQSAALRQEVLQDSSDTSVNMAVKAIAISLDDRIGRIPKRHFHPLQRLACA